MNDRQLHALTLRETDVDAAVHRLCDSEALYSECLKAFIEDTTITELNNAINALAWDDAFTYAHALKGLAGNMGFIPLMHSVGQLVVLIRGGRIKNIAEYIAQVNSSYRDITDAINQYFAYADDDEKGII